MNSTIKISFVAVLAVAALVSYAKADTLRQDINDPMLTTHYYHFINDTDNNGWHYGSSFMANSDALNDNFRVFCIDRTTQTSSDFASGEGQTYGLFSLNSPSMTLYTEMQKTALNSLFSHVYSTVFDNEGNAIDENSVAAYVYQLAVWEIVHEESGHYAINGGTFGIDGAATYPTEDHTGAGIWDSVFYNSAVDLVNSWFNAISGITDWDTIGYGATTNHELTVYVAEGGVNVSQTLISVINTENPGSGSTPEPATMLIFGLGIAGLGLVRRRVH